MTIVRGGAVEIKILVNCPLCHESLMQTEPEINRLPSIHFLAKIHDKLGHLYLSQVYGSYHKIFDAIEDIPDSIVECSCPHCYQPFPIKGECECKAPIILLGLHVGGSIKVCSRNGCKHHSLEFEDVDSAYTLFKSQDQTGLL